MTAGLLATAFLVSAGANELLAAGLAAYEEGLAARADSARARPHFRLAAEAFEAAWDRGARTPATARNMAQARYLAGELGWAVRDYRRGLAAFPHDPELRAGLAFAREQVQYPQASDLTDAARPRDADALLDRLPPSFGQLAGLAVVVAGLGWLVLARAWVAARGRLALVGGLLVLFAAGAGGWLYREDVRLRARWADPAAVVIEPGADLRTGNSTEYPKRLDGHLPAGVEAKVLGERGGWLHIELGGGTVGWVPAGRVVPVH